MPDGQEPIAVRVLARLDQVAAAEWDACAGADDPFVSHGFLDPKGARAVWTPDGAVAH